MSWNIRSIKPNNKLLVPTGLASPVVCLMLLLLQGIAAAAEIAVDTDKSGGAQWPFILGNPTKLWISERLEDKRTVLKLAFAERLAYTRNEGLRTPKLALPFKVLADFSQSKMELARPTGFEPATCSFGGCHSIHLSYGRTKLILQEIRYIRYFGWMRGWGKEWAWLEFADVRPGQWQVSKRFSGRVTTRPA